MILKMNFESMGFLVGNGSNFCSNIINKASCRCGILHTYSCQTSCKDSYLDCKLPSIYLITKGCQIGIKIIVNPWCYYKIVSWWCLQFPINTHFRDNLSFCTMMYIWHFDTLTSISKSHLFNFSTKDYYLALAPTKGKNNIKKFKLMDKYFSQQ